MLEVTVFSSEVQRGTSHLALSIHCKVLSPAHSLSVHSVFFITFYCVAFKVAILSYWLDQKLSLAAVQQLHVSAERSVVQQ